MQQAREWSKDYQSEYPRDYKYMIPPHNWYITIDYTAKNGFGGSVRNDFSCMYLGDEAIRINGKNVRIVNDDLTLSYSR